MNKVYLGDGLCYFAVEDDGFDSRIILHDGDHTAVHYCETAEEIKAMIKILKKAVKSYDDE